MEHSEGAAAAAVQQVDMAVVDTSEVVGAGVPSIPMVGVAAATPGAAAMAVAAVVQVCNTAVAAEVAAVGICMAPQHTHHSFTTNNIRDSSSTRILGIMLITATPWNGISSHS